MREDGTPAAQSAFPSASDDGASVVFLSRDPELVADPDAPSRTDIFVRDRALCSTERVSVGSDGSTGLDDSYAPTLSRNGRYATFFSDAWNLVAGDTNEEPDVFIHDRVLRITERVSVGSDGAEGDAESGRPGFFAPVSNDGRLVAFTSYATSLVPGIPPLQCPPSEGCGTARAFVRDRSLGVTELIDVPGTNEFQSTFVAGLSADGKVLAIASDPTGIASRELYLIDLVSGARQIANDTAAGARLRVSLGNPVALSNDGCTAVFPFLDDATSVPAGLARFSCTTGSAEIIVPGGTGIPPGLSADGRWLAHGLFLFPEGGGTPQLGLALRDLTGQEPSRQLASEGVSGGFAVSADGRAVMATIDSVVTAFGRLPGVPTRCEQIVGCDEETGSSMDDALCIVTHASSQGACATTLPERVLSSLMLVRATIHDVGEEATPSRLRRLIGRLGRQLKRARTVVKRAIRQVELDTTCGNQLLDELKRARLVARRG